MGVPYIGLISRLVESTRRKITVNKQNEHWPKLSLDPWQDTYETLHLWSQIVGKIRLAQMPWINHSWHVPLYVAVSGLTTSIIPHGTRAFEIDFELQHQLESVTLLA